MDPHRVDVLDRAHDDERVGRVAHDLELELLPSEDGLLDEDLVHRRERQSAPDDGLEIVLVEGDASARAAQREGGTDDDGVAERRGDSPGFVDRPRDPREQDLHADPLHGLLEEEAVLAELHRAYGRAERLDPVLFEDAGLVEGDREVESRLTADGREERVRPLLRDDGRDGVAIERFDVRGVRELGIRHDRRRIRVHENDPIAFRRSARQAWVPE